MYKAKSLSVNIAANVINQVCAALFPLITFPHVSRVLSPEGLGRVSFAEAIVSYFVMLATLGIPLYGVRESAKRRNDEIALSTLVLELFALNAIMTAIALAAFGAFMLLSHKACTDPALFWICALPMFLMPLGFNWLLGGLEEYIYIPVRTFAVRVLVTVAVFLFIRTPEDFRIYALIAALNNAGVNLLNLLFVRKHISVRVVDWRRLNVWRHVTPVLLIFSLGSLVSIYTSLNKVMLGCGRSSRN
jgi:O-antigen/teichoic acid export membrane protein